jgi:hypothetical protein
MSSKLTKLIAETETRREQKGTGVKNRAVFLVLRDDIKEALNDGWAFKQIYRTLYSQQKINFSYQTFMNYANALILMPKSSEANHQQVQLPKAGHEQTDASAEPLPKKSYELPSFIFNPIANKEDLI